jgi:hypothetical protein
VSECVLTVVDTTGIQGYVFGSNRLRENVGASELVERSTKEWVFETLAAMGRVNMVRHEHDHWEFTQATLEDDVLADDALAVEVLYAGGGNTVMLFAGENGPKAAERARLWAQQWSFRILRDAPGLGVAVAHSEPFPWKPLDHDLPKRQHDLIEVNLARAKRNPVASAPLLGLSVTASCQSTGLVAVGVDELDQVRVSRAAQRKLAASKAADKRFRTAFDSFFARDRLGLELAYDFDDLGRSHGEQSYIAVVHADGNKMGERFKRIAQDNSTNRQYITALRDLSKKVQQIGIAALNEMLSPLIDKHGNIAKGIPHYHNEKEDKHYLPFRPLVYGGDDVTFVCDGRLGLTLATRYLRAFERSAQKELHDPIRACAGIAIVKSHYPFARAYALSETLCRNAKGLIPQQDDFSALDWHISPTGLLGGLHDIRTREYVVPSGVDSALPNGGNLTMRPLRLHLTTMEWRAWPAFEQAVSSFKSDEEWRDKRNKIMQLREVLRAGPTRTEQFRKLYGLDDLPGYTLDTASGLSPFPAKLHKEGWASGVCAYFDPIEAMDFYIALEEAG